MIDTGVDDLDYTVWAGDVLVTFRISRRICWAWAWVGIGFSLKLTLLRMPAGEI